MKPFLCIILAFGLNACGIDSTQYLTVLVYGSNTVPEGVTGDTTPFNVGMTLVSVGFSASTSGAVTASDGTITDVTIIDRPQKILEYDLKDLVDENLTALTVTFDGAFTAETLSEELTGTITTPATVLNETLTVETEKHHHQFAGQLEEYR